jgi:type III restriction enzyme
VWVDGLVVAIDTKGDHLITEDAGRKLFFIDKMEEGPELVIRLVTEGAWHIAPTGQYGKITSSEGYPVWMLRQGKPYPFHCANITKAVERCLRTSE